MPELRKIEPNPTLAAPPAEGFAERGSSTYGRISLALFLAGFATFSLLYCVQPLLPVFATDFHVSPAGSSLSLSMSTGCLAFAILCAAPLSEGIGRRGLMFISMTAAAGLNLAAAWAPNWSAMLLTRALEGLLLGGVPAVAMAYLAEEIAPQGLGFAMGLYVAGTAFGGMIGRVGTGIMAEHLTWRLALGVVSLIGLGAAFGFAWLLPPSRHFIRRRGLEPRVHLLAWRGHLQHRGLAMLFLIGFLAMGAFVAAYNYAGFRLVAAPFYLSQTALGLVFTVYLFGIAASSAAGALSDRLGRQVVLPAGFMIMTLGIAMTLAQQLGVFIGGMAILTMGFFITHAVASAWVGRLAEKAKGHAASLYLLAYYLGSSVVGSTGGWFYAHGGWNRLVVFTALLCLLGIVAALRMRALHASGQNSDGAGTGSGHDQRVVHGEPPSTL